ncbi:hypothetical protein O9K51_03134 [Purpureocillium lavendulum]|uniref:Uncharacterized protein n=1 Tax=Purpureocillium lavendulum TaxID=1247861 RepID=A0AB34G115_9HYPO|nr:hypothetical protein O9K51_03134 [Purpureocillium lavendulum]
MKVAAFVALATLYTIGLATPDEQLVCAGHIKPRDPAVTKKCCLKAQVHGRESGWDPESSSCRSTNILKFKFIECCKQEGRMMAKLI